MSNDFDNQDMEQEVTENNDLMKETVDQEVEEVNPEVEAVDPEAETVYSETEAVDPEVEAVDPEVEAVDQETEAVDPEEESDEILEPVCLSYICTPDEAEYLTDSFGSIKQRLTRNLIYTALLVFVIVSFFFQYINNGYNYTLGTVLIGVCVLTGFAMWGTAFSNDKASRREHTQSEIKVTISSDRVVAETDQYIKSFAYQYDTTCLKDDNMLVIKNKYYYTGIPVRVFENEEELNRAIALINSKSQPV